MRLPLTDRSRPLLFSQGATSASNFVLFAAWGTVSSPDQLGRFSVLFACIVVSIGVARGLYLEPLLLNKRLPSVPAFSTLLVSTILVGAPAIIVLSISWRLGFLPEVAQFSL